MRRTRPAASLALAALAVMAGCPGDVALESGFGRLEASVGSWQVYTGAQGELALFEPETGRYGQSIPDGMGGRFIDIQTDHYFVSTQLDATDQIVGPIPAPEMLGELTELWQLLSATFPTDQEIPAPGAADCPACAGVWSIALKIGVWALATAVGLVIGFGVPCTATDARRRACQREYECLPGRPMTDQGCVQLRNCIDAVYEWSPEHC